MLHTLCFTSVFKENTIYLQSYMYIAVKFSAVMLLFLLASFYLKLKLRLLLLHCEQFLKSWFVVKGSVELLLATQPYSFNVVFKSFTSFHICMPVMIVIYVSVDIVILLKTYFCVDLIQYKQRLQLRLSKHCN